MHSSKPVYIYGLTEAGSDEIRYVGKTVDLVTRWRHHSQSSRLRQHCHRVCWIRSVHETGSFIRLIVLETATNDGWADAERWWIRHLASTGHRLTNATVGGDGSLGLRHTDKAKQRMSESARTRWSNPAEHQSLSEARRVLYRDPGFRRRQSETSRQTMAQPAVREKIADSLRGRHASAESRKRQSDARRGERNPLARLTAEDIPQIRRLYAEGKTITTIAPRFGVCVQSIWNVITGRTWSHID